MQIDDTNSHLSPTDRVRAAHVRVDYLGGGAGCQGPGEGVYAWYLQR